MSKIYDTLQYVEAHRRGAAGGDPAEPQNPLDAPHEPRVARHASAPILEQAAAVTRFTAELNRRMGEAGVDGLAGLFALADRLTRALATVSPSEIERFVDDLGQVAERARTMQGDLRHLKSVKTELEGSLAR